MGGGFFCFLILSVWDLLFLVSVHSTFCLLEILSVQDFVGLGYCPFGILSIWICPIQGFVFRDFVRGQLMLTRMRNTQFLGEPIDCGQVLWCFYLWKHSKSLNCFRTELGIYWQWEFHSGPNLCYYGIAKHTAKHRLLVPLLRQTCELDDL